MSPTSHIRVNANSRTLCLPCNVSFLKLVHVGLLCFLLLCLLSHPWNIFPCTSFFLIGHEAARISASRIGISWLNVCNLRGRSDFSLFLCLFLLVGLVSRPFCFRLVMRLLYFVLHFASYHSFELIIIASLSTQHGSFDVHEHHISQFS